MMLAGFSVRRYQFTVVVFLMLSVSGVSAWRAIPRQEDPSFPVPIYSVIAVYPGATPTDLERLVVKPVEDRVNELEDLDHIDARMEDGLAVVRIEFEAGVDADRKYDDVLRELNALRPDLPEGLTVFEVEKASSQSVTILQLGLVSGLMPWAALDSLAELFEDRIESVPGIRGAERWGAPAREVRVALDLGRLRELALPPGTVLQALGSESVDLPGGSVDAGGRRFNVKTTGSYGSPGEVAATVVTHRAGTLVRVGDVATVAWGEADPTHLGRYNGRRAMFLTATLQDGQNIVRVRDDVWRELDRLERMLPAGVTLERGFDQSANVQHRLSRLGTDFAIAVALVLVTLLPIGTRASLIVMVSIPLSLAIGVTLLSFTGHSINQLSIVGFVIALGLLVDDSIVVVENIARFLREGASRMEAAIQATGQIAAAVMGSTATLVLAFVPLALLPGLPGRYIRSMPLAVIFTVTASLLVSFTIIPWLASRLLRDGEAAQAGRLLQAVMRGIDRTYAPLLHRALVAPRRTLLLAGALVLASLGLVPLVGFSLFPRAETPMFLVDISAPDGSNLQVTDRAARFAEGVVSRYPDVRAVFTSVGRDNPQVYYNVTPRRENAAAGQLFVLLQEYHPGRTPRLLDSVRRQLAAWPGARLELREFENGPPIDAPVALRISGPDLDSLRGIAGRVEQLLRRTPGTQYVFNPVRWRRTDLRLVLDRDKAGMLGVAPGDFDRLVRLGIAGIPAGTVRESDGDERPVVVRLAHAGRPRMEALERIYLPAAAGGLTPLGQVASPEFSASATEIQRYNRERTVTVTSWVGNGYNTDRVTRQVLARLGEIPLPMGYGITPAGEIESRQESFGGIGSAVMVALLLILAILVLEFGSFRSTLIVASVIPLGFVGGMAALFLSGNTLSFTATIGFVALLGIEIKTSILLVDHINHLRRQGLPLLEAIQRGGEVRFLPILLTAFAAIGGLLPIALQGAALYAPIAWVIIGGLISSTLLARLVTPVMYRLLAPVPE